MPNLVHLGRSLAARGTASRVDARQCLAVAALDSIQQLACRTDDPAWLVPDGVPVGALGLQGGERAPGRLLAGVARGPHLTDAVTVVAVAGAVFAIAVGRAVHEHAGWSGVLDGSLLAHAQAS